jgi:NADH:ubiquinone oxidoreductase subunit E
MDKVLHKILAEFRKDSVNLIALLQRIQDAYGYLPEETVTWFAEQLDIPESKFFGIITFYPKFRMKPLGKNAVTVCCGAACHIKGSDAIIKRAREALKLREGEDTTPDLQFTIQTATCIGACNIAPVVVMNKQVHGGMDPVKVTKLIKGYEKEDEFIGYF